MMEEARLEPALAGATEAVQFERLGYFCRDQDSTPARLVFNRAVGLRDSYAKETKGAAGKAAGGAKT